jgi:hypothetical protein
MTEAKTITGSFDPSRCRNCGGDAWVCENHPDRPWDGTSGSDDACGCGAGAPCAVCSPAMANAHLIQTLERTRDRLAGVVSQMDFAGCTCTFPSGDCCSYAAAEATIADAGATLAIATEARRAVNAEGGAVHEGAGRKASPND